MLCIVHPCFGALCLTHSFPHLSPHRVLHLHPVRRLLLRCSILRRVHPLPLCKEGCASADWAEQSPLTGYEPRSLIEVSSEHTPINLPSRNGSVDTIDTTDVGRLTSQLFLGARSECPPIQRSWFSNTFKRRETRAGHSFFSCIGTLVQDGESFSSFERPLLTGKRNRELESVQLFSYGKGKIFLNRNAYMNSSNRTAGQAFFFSRRICGSEKII